MTLLPWTLAIAEGVLLYRVWRRGSQVSFPAYSLYLLATFISTVLFALRLPTPFMWLQTAMVPVKCWVCWEAIRMRFWYVRVPRGVRGDRYWTLIAGIGVATMLLFAIARLEGQYNLPVWFAKPHSMLQVGIASVLGVACGIAMIRQPVSTPRATAHLWILFGWFAIAASNSLPIAKGEGDRWLEVGTVAQLARVALIGAWMWLFRSRGRRDVYAKSLA